MIGPDRYAMDACVRLEIDAVVVRSVRSWDGGLMQVPEPLTDLRVEDQANPEQVLAGLHRAGLAASGFDAVHTTDEFALVTAALLAEHLRCRTMGADAAARFRDKSLQKARVAAAGIKTAGITVIEDVYDVSAIAETPYRRAVLKPIAGAATARTTAVADLDELRARSRMYEHAHIPERTFALEEFVEGEEWVVDGVLFDGQLLFAGVGAYRQPCLSTIEQNVPLSMRRFDPEQDEAVYAAALPFAASALRALGLRDGVFHLELFHDPDTGELTFGECAARRGGGLIHEEIQAKFNVHLGECALLCALGRRPPIEAKVRPGVVASGYLPGRAGLLVDCPTPAELRELPGVEFARIESCPGSPSAEGAGTTSERIGMVLVAADTAEAADVRLAEVREWFAERLLVAPSGPPRAQRAWQKAAWPDHDFGDVLWH